MHVTLMPFSGGYAQALASLCQAADRTYLSGRLPSPYTLRDAQAFIRHVSEEDGKAGLFRAIVMDGALVGNISVERKSGISCRDAEIGYLLHPRCASQGIMTQAVGQMCALAFARFDLLRITGLVFAPNAASRRVLEKNGFALEGTLRDSAFKDGRAYDLCVYGLLRENKTAGGAP